VAAVASRRPAEPERPDPAPAVEAPETPVADSTILRHFAKRHLAQEAAAGVRPLTEAAALFGELNRVPPELIVMDHPTLRGRSEGERLCRQVIAYARGLGWPETVPSSAAARMEAELDQELARYGTLRLPDPAGLPAATDLLDQARARLTKAQFRALFSDPHDGPGE
jgi:hypothetical protein